MDRPGPSHSAASTSSATPETMPQNYGMKAPTSYLEWQLQAVLFRAKLTQYYDTFINQGGDDIDQLMDCDETEFLEIMSLVGMASKPLHVRRLQRTLADFSKNREAFLQESIKSIGAPPVPTQLTTQVDPTEALRVLLSQPLQEQFSRSQTLFGDAPSTSTPFRLPFPNISAQPSSSSLSSAPPISFAALPPADILAIVSGTQIQSSQPIPLSLASMILSPSTSTSVIARSSPTTSTQQPNLSESDIEKLKNASILVLKSNQDIEPKTTQRKPTREVQLAIAMPEDHPERLAKFQQLSTIYGRSDSKRRPQKVLTHHEVLINEAANQICLQKSDYLARRSELFALARQAARLSGLQQHGIRDMESRARYLGEQSISPSIRSTPTPDEFLTTRSDTASVEPKDDPETSQHPTKRRRESSSTSSIDPKRSKQ